MPFCHIYARRDGTFTVRMHGTISRGKPSPFRGATVLYRSSPFASEEAARRWIDLGRWRDGLEDMPEPHVIYRTPGLQRKDQT